MPINGISVGRDVTLTFTDSTGAVITLPRLKNFSSKQKTSNRESASLDGINRHVNIPMGWEGSFEFERTGPELDNYINSQESLYYAGKNVSTATITETITEADGSVNQWQYIGCVFTYESAGDWKAEEYITQKLAFSAQERNPQQ